MEINNLHIIVSRVSEDDWQQNMTQQEAIVVAWRLGAYAVELDMKAMYGQWVIAIKTPHPNHHHVLEDYLFRTQHQAHEFLGSAPVPKEKHFIATGSMGKHYKSFRGQR